MKAVMIAIQPLWCGLIASKEKTIEIRKTRPKLDSPFKCYIYETRSGTDAPWADEDGHLVFRGRGQIIGEFVCDRIIPIANFGSTLYTENLTRTSTATLSDMACLDFAGIKKYLGEDDGFAWHIANVQIYETPMDLSDFSRPCTHRNDCFTCRRYDRKHFSCDANLRRPPQSWYYVEG